MRDAKKKQALKVKVVLHDWEQLNKNKPLWMYKSEDVANEHASFDTSLPLDREDHLAVKHFSVEGQRVFRALQLVPCRFPLDFFESKKDSNMTCYLKEAQSEFLEERRLSDLVKKRSEFIGFPVLYVEKSKEKEVTNFVDEE